MLGGRDRFPTEDVELPLCGDEAVDILRNRPRGSAELLELFELPVVDRGGRLVGLIDLTDLIGLVSADFDAGSSTKASPLTGSSTNTFTSCGEGCSGSTLPNVCSRRVRPSLSR